MRNDKHLATKLRKEGLSYQEISNKLDIPKSTLSNWFSDKNWSQKVKRKLTKKSYLLSQKRLKKLNEAKQKKWRNWREKFRKKARKEFVELKENPLFIAGLMLYWGEGDSKPKNGLVRLGNTEPEMINVFRGFFKKFAKYLRKR